MSKTNCKCNSCLTKRHTCNALRLTYPKTAIKALVGKVVDPKSRETLCSYLYKKELNNGR